jgi:hypothetical protein
MPRPSTPAPRAVRAAAVTALAVTAAGAAAACGDTVDRLLTVQTPSRLADSVFLAPGNARPITNSAQVDFECAYNAYVTASGLASGELADGSQTAARWSYDRREVLPADALYSTASCTGLGVYTPISTARFTNDQALARLEGWTDAEVANRAALRLNAAVYAGYSYLLLAEGFCSAAVSESPELTTENLLDSAEARFTRAVELAQEVTGARRDTLLNAAYVGRARARIGSGERAGAAEDAARVPLGFVLNATAGNAPDRRVNRVFQQNNVALAVTVAPAYRNLTVQGVPDPRVRVIDLNRTASDNVNRLFAQTKYAGLSSPIPIASGVEAQLILAEARGGAEGVAILNALRARPGVALAPLTVAEAADFQNTIFEERRRELFLQGTRWYDLRRGNLPLVPAPGVVYANGLTPPKGGAYGDQRCWPLPDVERAANPNFSAS